MENFYISLNAVLPMFIMLFIGFAIRKLNILKESFLPQLNKLVFTVFFPFLMFNNIFGSDFSSVFNPKLLIFAVAAVAVIYMLSVGFTLIAEKSNYSRGAMIQAIYRSNFVLMGMPIFIPILCYKCDLISVALGFCYLFCLMNSPVRMLWRSVD